MAIELDVVRAQFPALAQPYIYLDNPGGTQICRPALDSIQNYLIGMNANHGGRFATSRASDALVDEARAAAADFLNAHNAEEIVFGPNMTSLTFSVSRALGATFNPGDLIVLTRMDHDANISPWLRLAEDRGLRVRFVDFDVEDGTLNLDDMAAALDEKPRLLAVGYASNALGTINPLDRIIPMAHAAGALVYVDAVQYAPHGPIDVQRLDADFLVCSAYKFFGPHMAVLYGRQELLESLPAYRVRPAPAHGPGKFETGTGNFEHMAGLLGTLNYFEWLGRRFGGEYAELHGGDTHGRRLIYKQAMSVLHAYEQELGRALQRGLLSLPGAHLYGIADEARLDERVPTYAVTFEGHSPAELAEKLGQRGINVWDGNFYALEVTTRLGLEDRGGLLRIGAAHYNSLDEIDCTVAALAELTA